MQSVRMQAVAMERGERRSAIRIDGLEKIYETRDGERIQALGPISLDIAEGEFLTIVGASGCGKSTLLRMLAGLIDRSAGEIRVRDTSIVGPQPDIGMVFQSPVLLPWKTTLANVMLPAAVLGLDPAASRKRAESLLDMVGLGAFRDKYPSELSGGMQQRVAIARALLHEPSILLMDEPFGALDAMTRERMNLELQRIQHETGKTVLLITHSIPEAVFLADRVMVMSERPGTIAATYEVPLPRPRTLDVMGDPVFVQLTQTIRAHFFTQGHLD